VSEDRRRSPRLANPALVRPRSESPPTRHVLDTQRIGECLVRGLIPRPLVRLSMSEFVTLRSTQAPSMLGNESRKLGLIRFDGQVACVDHAA
jgi:hypothetical protein